MKKILIIALSLIFVSCSHHSGELPKESNVKVTKSLKGNRWGNIYFSGQPNAKSLKSLKKSGFATVINLRKKTEGRYVESWEAGVVKNQGLNYYNVPFDMSVPLSDEYITSVTSKIMKHKKEGKILVHCSSGNRVAIWLGGHFKKDHGFSNKKSLELAKELGLNKRGAENKLDAYLRK